MPDESSITPEIVRSLAAAARLPLGPEREALVAEQLDVWLAGANALSEKMSAPEHRGRTPIVSFTHPETEVAE